MKAEQKAKEKAEKEKGQDKSSADKASGKVKVNDEELSPNVSFSLWTFIFRATVLFSLLND